MNNGFSTVHPELVSEWSEQNDLVIPDQITYGSNRIVWWKGTCGHEWQASVKSRSSGEGCPICSGARVISGINDLASVEPELAAEWSAQNEIKPTEVSVGSHKKVFWKGRCGHEWEATVKSRASRNGCPFCAHRKILAGFNDLATLYPKVAAEWSERNLPLTPDSVNDKSRQNVWWKCQKCGYEWKSVVASRVKGAACPVCADRYILIGYNDLATTHSEFLKEWDFEKNVSICPERLSAKAMKSVWWRCKCGHSWKGTIRERIFEKRGCSICEQEFQSVFPQLVVKFYTDQQGLRTIFYSDDIIGIPIDIYIPDEKLAITVHVGAEKTERIKEHLCRKRKIRYIQRPYTNRRLENDYVKSIIEIFHTIHIYFSTDIDRDMALIKKSFIEWRTGQISE